MIQDKEYNRVFIDEENCSSLRETFYLMLTPGKAQSIKEGFAEPIDQGDEKFD